MLLMLNHCVGFAFAPKCVAELCAAIFWFRNEWMTCLRLKDSAETLVHLFTDAAVEMTVQVVPNARVQRPACARFERRSAFQACMTRPRGMHFIPPGRCNELLEVTTFNLCAGTHTRTLVPQLEAR